MSGAASPAVLAQAAAPPPGAVVAPGAVALPPTVAALPTREQVLPQARRENFTVASVLLGRRRARQLMAIYGFARLVDDVGDEAPGDRGALLDLVALELRRAFAQTGAGGAGVGESAVGEPGLGEPGLGEPGLGEPGLGEPQHPLMRELAVTVRECRLPIGPFERLIEANRRDQVVTHYESFGQLLDYCQLSAAPVGELVLGVFGATRPDRVALSDRVCAGLQVVEHLQDIVEDHSRGRVYVPREDLEHFGCSDEDLARSRPPAALRALIAFEAARARALLASGAQLASTLPPAPRLAVAGFTAGGLRALDALERDPGSRAASLDGTARLAYIWQVIRTAAGR